MNNKQKTVLWLGLAAIILMGLFPPIRYSRSIRYKFLFDAYRTVALSNLVVQWVVVALGTGGLIYAFKDKKPKDEQSLKGKAISCKTGFKRITLILAIVIAVVCGVFAGSLPIDKYSDADNWWDKDPPDRKPRLVLLEPKKPKRTLDDLLAMPKPRQPGFVPDDAAQYELQERQSRSRSRPGGSIYDAIKEGEELKELQSGFWANLSKPELVGLCILSGLGGAAAGYLGTWLVVWFGGLAIYKLIMWLVIGFKVDAAEQEAIEKPKQMPEPTREH